MGISTIQILTILVSAIVPGILALKLGRELYKL
nr:photosystem I protein M [Flexiglena variabilis]WCH63468.1 photosystem I protein M [Flexiglena variabilis]